MNPKIAKLRAAFTGVSRVTIIGRGPSANDPQGESLPRDHVLITGPTYVNRDVFDGEPMGVLIGTPPKFIRNIAKRFYDTPIARRPILLYTFLPSVTEFDFSEFDISPYPILPALIASGLYDPTIYPYPTSGVFLVLLATALGLLADITGIDLYQHPSGKTYINERANEARFDWPSHHSLECDVEHLRRANNHAPGRLCFSRELQQFLSSTPGASEESE